MGQKIRFLISCTLSTLADFVVLTTLVQIVKAPVFFAALVGATLGATINFLMQRYFVFDPSNPKRGQKRKQIPQYAFVAVTTILIASGLTAVLADHVGLNYLISRVIAGIATLVCWHYPFSRLIFRPRASMLCQ